MRYGEWEINYIFLLCMKNLLYVFLYPLRCDVIEFDQWHCILYWNVQCVHLIKWILILLAPQNNPCQSQCNIIFRYHYLSDKLGNLGAALSNCDSLYIWAEYPKSYRMKKVLRTRRYTLSLNIVKLLAPGLFSVTFL